MYTSRGTRYPSIRRYGLLVVAAGLATAVALTVAFSAGAATTSKPFQAVITPPTVGAGSSDVTYTYTITNLTSQEMGSANVTIPSGWTDVKITSVTTSVAGKTWYAVDTTPTDGDLLGAEGFIELRNNGPANTQKLGINQSVTVSFTADAPCTAPANDDWTPVVKQANNFNGAGNEFYLQAAGSDIDVTLGPPSGSNVVTGFEFGTIAAGTQVVAGTQLPVTVTALGACGGTATGFNGTAILGGLDNAPDSTAPGYGGTGTNGETIQFSGGVASVNVTGVDRTTSDTLSVSDGTHSATSGAFEVLPAAPAELSVLTQPTDTPLKEVINPSGGVVVELLDAYENRVDANLAGYQRSVQAAITPPTTATLGGTTTVTSSAGLATFSTLTINKMGTYTLDFTDVTSAAGLAGRAAAAGTTSDPFEITVGYAYKLVIDEIPNHLFGTQFGSANPPLSAVRVRTQDVDGNFGAPLRAATTVQLTMGVQITSPPHPYTGPIRVNLSQTVTAGSTQWLFSGFSYPVLENSIVATASRTSGDQLPGGSTASTSPFDVVQVLIPVDQNDLVVGTQNANGDACTDTTPADNTCITVYLANGATSSWYLQEGNCNINPNDPNDACIGNLMGLFPTTFDGTNDSDFSTLFHDYTATNPVRAVIEWDKTISGQRGAPKTVLYYAIEDGPLLVAPDCAVKNVVGPGQFCINKKNRQGDGDTEYEVIFYGDLITKGK